ncbi:MAG: sulfite exporter TauE/SafE family protein [Patescibacteria group bacterium]|jgi:hypothetical protein
MLIIILVGFFIGALIGMTSMGGGAMMTPILIIFLHIEPAIAIGSDIIYGAITKSVGTWQHLRQKTVDLKLVKHLAYGSVPGSIIGALSSDWLRHAVTNSDEYLKLFLGLAICFSASILTISLFFDVRHLKTRLHNILQVEKFQLPYTILAGFLGGTLVGLTSVGAGSIMLVLMLIIYNTSTRKLVGSDIAHATVLLFTSGIVHLFAGNVDWLLVLGLLIGSIPGVLIGSRLAHFVPLRYLKIVLVLVLTFLGGQLVYRFF